MRSARIEINGTANYLSKNLQHVLILHVLYVIIVIAREVNTNADKAERDGKNNSCRWLGV